MLFGFESAMERGPDDESLYTNLIIFDKKLVREICKTEKIEDLD